MSEISKEKFLEAEEHFCELQTALYELMSHAYGDDIANLLFQNLCACEIEEDCDICQEEARKECLKKDYEAIKQAMSYLERLFNPEK